MPSLLSRLSLGHFFYSLGSTFRALKPGLISLITVLASRHMGSTIRCKQQCRALPFSFAWSSPSVRHGNICIWCRSSPRLEGKKEIHTFKNGLQIDAGGEASPRRDAMPCLQKKMTTETNWSTSFWLNYSHKDKHGSYSRSWGRTYWTDVTRRPRCQESEGWETCANVARRAHIMCDLNIYIDFYFKELEAAMLTKRLDSK